MYPVALHSVGLSLGSDEPLNQEHAARLRALVASFDPLFVSEHLSFSGMGGLYTNALLPLRYDDETLGVLAAKVDELQTLLGRQVLLENPARYLALAASTTEEPEFLAALVAHTGCGLLCDVTNIHVSAENLGFDSLAYLDALPARAVQEIHLAGYATRRYGDCVILLDDHGSRIPDPIWRLYAAAVRRFGEVPALIEWDTALPDLATLVGEATQAEVVASAELLGARACA